MPTPTKGARMGGSPAHQKHMLANLAAALFEHGKITTTEARARRLRPYAEKLITFAKRGDLHARRQVMTVVPDKSVVHSLFTEIGPGFADRAGGYTRITKLGPRKGDAAPMAVIELVGTRSPRPGRAAAPAAPRLRRLQAPRPPRSGRPPRLMRPPRLRLRRMSLPTPMPSTRMPPKPTTSTSTTTRPKTSPRRR